MDFIAPAVAPESKGPSNGIGSSDPGPVAGSLAAARAAVGNVAARCKSAATQSVSRGGACVAGATAAVGVGVTGVAPAAVYLGGNAALVTGSTGLANLIGFSAAGPVAGSMAAAAQAAVGNVAAGSTFAAVQSMAMGGAGAATAMGTAVGVGVVAAPFILIGGGVLAFNPELRKKLKKKAQDLKKMMTGAEADDEKTALTEEKDPNLIPVNDKEEESETQDEAMDTAESESETESKDDGKSNKEPVLLRQE